MSGFLGLQKVRGSQVKVIMRKKGGRDAGHASGC